MKYFTGVGSRGIDSDTYYAITQASAALLHMGLGLRSGAAQGADTAFEEPFIGRDTQIFLPWARYNGHASEHYNIPPRAFEIAESVYIHDWQRIKPSIQKLMARNVQQVLGPTLTKGEESLFVLCWTKDGCDCHEYRQPQTGGTGQAISVASQFDIPVINMYNDNWKIKLSKILEDI